MEYRGLFWLVSSLLLALLVDVCFSYDFQPIDPPDSDYGHQLYSRDLSAKREDPTTPARFLSLFSAAENGTFAAMVNFTILAEDNTAILSMERFRSLLDDDLNCTPKGMTFSFKDPDSYHRGKEAWEWVNEADDRNFILITSIEDCDHTQKGNKNRVFWLVKNVLFSPQGRDVEITAKKGKWEDFVGSFIWNVGPKPPSLKKRGILDKLEDFDEDTSFSMDFDHSFGKKDQNKSLGNTGFTWTCENCGSTGKFETTFTLKAEKWKLSEARLSFSPQKVSFNIDPMFGLYGVKLKNVVSDDVELFRKAIPPIPGIDALSEWVRLGPYIVVRVGYSIGPLEADGTFAKPYSVKVHDKANAEMVIKNKFKDMDATSSDWEAEVSDHDLDVNGTLSGVFRINFNVGLVLTGEFGKKDSDSVVGLEGGLHLVPFLGANLTLSSSEDGKSCPKSEKKFENILEAAPLAGGDFKLLASINGEQRLNKKLKGYTKTLATTCTGFGSVSVAKSSESATTPDPTKSGKSSKSPEPSSEDCIPQNTDEPYEQNTLPVSGPLNTNYRYEQNSPYPTATRARNNPFQPDAPVQTGTRGNNNNIYYHPRMGSEIVSQENPPQNSGYPYQPNKNNQQEQDDICDQQENGGYLLPQSPQEQGETPGQTGNTGYTQPQNFDQRPNDFSGQTQNLDNGQLEEDCQGSPEQYNDWSENGFSDQIQNTDNQLTEAYADESPNYYRGSQYDTGPGPQDSVHVYSGRT